jgi:hypothetical protein
MHQISCQNQSCRSNHLISGLKQARDKVIGLEALGFCFVIQNHAMRENFVGDSLHVFDVWAVLPMGCCMAFGTQHQVLRRTGARSPLHQVFGEITGLFRTGTG